MVVTHTIASYLTSKRTSKIHTGMCNLESMNLTVQSELKEITREYIHTT